jgi:phosphotransferase family enzyme
MTPNPTNALETWAVLLVSRDGEQVLLVKENQNWSLPRVEIPTQERIAANINRVIQRDFGIPVISLYPVVPADSDAPGGNPYHVVAALPTSGNSLPGSEWTLISTLSEQSFSRLLDFSAIRTFRTGLERKEIARGTEPFLRPDWFTDATRWIADMLRPHALRLTGSFEQFNADSIFSLIRFETNGGAVWFKAVGAHNSREFPITLALAKLCPAQLPKILASKSEWRAWLAADASGDCLRATRAAHVWEDAAANIAQLQIRCMSASGAMHSAGARDLASASLRLQAELFFSYVASSQVIRPESIVPTLVPEELEDIKSAVQNSLLHLEALDLPDTIGHMDLNPGNIFSTDRGCVFLDWAESYVGNPFFSFEYLLQHFRQAVAPGVLEEDRFREAYFAPWQAVVSSQAMERAMSFVPLAALFAYATTLWSASIRCEAGNIPLARYLASLIRKMGRYVTHSRLEDVPS